MIKASKLQNIFLPFRFKRENVCLRTSHPDYINIRSFEKLHEFMSRKTFFLSFFSLSNSLECFYSEKKLLLLHTSLLNFLRVKDFSPSPFFTQSQM